MKKVLYTGDQTINITGGQKYNSEFREILKKDCNCDIIYANQIIKFPNLPKFFIPFAELKLLPYIRKCDYVFWGDSVWKYHFLVLILTRIFSKAKCIEIVHHYSFLNMKGFKRSFYKFCEKVYNSLMHYIIYPNPYIHQIGSKWNHENKIFDIPTHINKQLYRDVHPRKKEMLFVGTVEPRKGIHFLLKAIKIVKQRCNDVKLNIIGKAVNDNYFNMLNDYIKENNLNDNVSFLGRIKDEDLEGYYKRAYLFVFPSLLEGYGLSIVEAMQYGIPVVAFNNSAIPFTIKDGFNGFLVRNEDYKQFAEKIQTIIDNDNLRKDLSEGAYKTINQVKSYEDFRLSLISFMSSIK